MVYGTGLNRFCRMGREKKQLLPDSYILIGQESGNPFIYKNEVGNNKRDKYVNYIDQVECITCYDFFSALPDDIEKCIEQTYDLMDWR